MASRDSNSEDVFIAVMGVTGSGKSSFISKLCPDMKIGIGHSLASETKDIAIYSFKHKEKNVHLIDTPGFDDTHRSDTDILNIIANFLANLYQQAQFLGGVIYLHRISDQRFAGSSQRNFRMLRYLVGSENFSSVILATTCWDVVDYDQGTAREKELQDRFWKPMVEMGSIVMRHNNTQDSAINIITQILHRQTSITLAIQTELVDRGYLLAETTAGRFITDDLLKQRKKNQQEFEAVSDEMRNAIAAIDQNLVEEMVNFQTAEQIKISQLSKDEQDLSMALSMSLESKKKEREQELERRMLQAVRIRSELERPAQARLAQERLEHARLERARLEQAWQLEQAKVKQAKVEQAKVEQAKVEQAWQLERAMLKQERLEQLTLERARLEQLTLERARLEHARLEQARLVRRSEVLPNLHQQLELAESEQKEPAEQQQRVRKVQDNRVSITDLEVVKSAFKQMKDATKGSSNVERHEVQYFQENPSLAPSFDPIYSKAIDWTVSELQKVTFIAVMGQTGAGKSNFIQKASGNLNVRIGHGLASETQRVQFVEFFINKVPFVLIDTPGFNDTFRSEADILEEISTSLAITYKQEIQLAGVIYLQSILNPKMHGSALRNITIFNKLCGEDPLKKIILVTTFWDEIELDIGVKREEEFKRNFWLGRMFADSRLYRFFNTPESAIGVLRNVLIEGPVILNIQREIVDENSAIINTDAGQLLNEELNINRQELNSRLAIIQGKSSELREQSDESLQKELLEQQQEIKQELDELRRQQDVLKKSQRTLLKEFEEGWAQKLKSVQDECEAKEAARASLERKMNMERAIVKRRLEEESERASRVIEEIQVMKEQNRANHAWYEKRIRDLEEKTTPGVESKPIRLDTAVPLLERTPLIPWSISSTMLTGLVKGFVDQANRFFTTNNEYPGTRISTRTRGFIRLLSCFECERVPVEIFLRTCSPQRRWSTEGELVVEYASHTLIPTWLIDIFDGVTDTMDLPPDVKIACESGIIKVEENEGVIYYCLASGVKSNERSILLPQDYCNVLFDITSILIYSLPRPFSEILWEEIVWHCKEVAETTCLPFLAVVNISDVEQYVSKYPTEFRVPYLIQLLRFILDDSFYRNLTIPESTLQIVQLIRKQSITADADLAECFGIRLLRDLILQSFKAGIGAEKIMLIAKNGYCLDERLTATLAFTIDFLQRSAFSKSAREELADLAHQWTPYNQDHISTMELIAQTVISPKVPSDLLKQFQSIDLQLRTATGFALSQRQRFQLSRSLLELCIEGIQSIYSRSSHEYVTVSIELAHACNVLGDEGAGKHWAQRALFKTMQHMPSNLASIPTDLFQECTSTDLFALKISLADSLIGRGEYIEAQEFLAQTLKENIPSNYMIAVCALRLNKVHRRLVARDKLELNEKSPLWMAVNHLENAETALKIECAEELNSTLCVLQQGHPRGIAEIVPTYMLESPAMQDILSILNSHIQHKSLQNLG